MLNAEKYIKLIREIVDKSNSSQSDPVCDLVYKLGTMSEVNGCDKQDNCDECRSDLVDWMFQESGLEQSTNNDMVNHPPHYTREGALECIEEIETVLGAEGAVHYCLGCYLKYRYRNGEKVGADTDIEKSDWYIKKARELLQKVNK